ncbi:hypothetical protein [Nitrosopumilus sp.]|uniref:hypothetical protein n=1 Tax=Nitrosopumilus sp. TaxID=2024843 RepID=UPI002931494E|nr:hypothetical protein [Nitrosopumilus sp.]
MGKMEPLIARKQTSSGKKTKSTRPSSKKSKVNPRHGIIEPIIHRKPKPKTKTTSKKTTKTKTRKKTARSTTKKSRTTAPKRRTTTRRSRRS